MSFVAVWGSVTQVSLFHRLLMIGLDPSNRRECRTVYLNITHTHEMSYLVRCKQQLRCFSCAQ